MQAHKSVADPKKTLSDCGDWGTTARPELYAPLHYSLEEIEVKRYRALGSTVARSDRCGAWTWPAGQPPQGAHCERDLRRRFWHWRASDVHLTNDQTQ